MNLNYESAFTVARLKSNLLSFTTLFPILFCCLTLNPSSAVAQTSEDGLDPGVAESISTLISVFESTESKDIQLSILDTLTSLETGNKELVVFLAKLVESENKEFSGTAEAGISVLLGNESQMDDLILDWIKSGEESQQALAIRILNSASGKLESEIAGLIDNGMIENKLRIQLLNVFVERGAIEDETAEKLIEIYENQPELKNSLLNLFASVPVDSSMSLPFLNKLLKNESDEDTKLLAIRAIQAQLSSVSGRLAESIQRYQRLADQMFDRYDTNGDGQLSDADAGSSAVFATFDSDGNGITTRREMLRYFTQRMNSSRGSGRSIGGFGAGIPTRGGGPPADR